MADEKKLRIYQKIHWASMGIGALSILLPIICWKWIPDQIPMHYNAEGVIDNWADKSSMILMFFVIGMLMGLMAIVVYVVKSNMISQYTKEHDKNVYATIYPMLVLLNLALQLTFAYITFCTATARELGKWFLWIAMLGTFAPLVWMIYKSVVVKKRIGCGTVDFREAETKEMGTSYRSAVDAWLALVLIGTEGFMLWVFLEPLLKNEEFQWITFLYFVATTMLLYPLLQIRYVLYEKHLLVSMGWYGKIRIPYENITKMEKTMNPLSSAAMSLRRIQIDYTEGNMHQMVLISPVRRNEFIEEIEKRRN